MRNKKKKLQRKKVRVRKASSFWRCAHCKEKKNKKEKKIDSKEKEKSSFKNSAYWIKR